MNSTFLYDVRRERVGAEIIDVSYSYDYDQLSDCAESAADSTVSTYSSNFLSYVAHYEYDLFGRIAQPELMKDSFSFWSFTKYYELRYRPDNETEE